MGKPVTYSVDGLVEHARDDVVLAAEEAGEGAALEAVAETVRGDALAAAALALGLAPALARGLGRAHAAGVGLVPEHVVLAVRVVLGVGPQRLRLRRRGQYDELLARLARALRLGAARAARRAPRERLRVARERGE
jgi:hypothetical protein